MYSTSLRKELIAQHHMPNASGREKEVHSHRYTVEVTVRGSSLDHSGYLADLDRIGEVLDGILKLYSDRTLNDLPDFQEAAPSIENLAFAIWGRFVAADDWTSVSTAKVAVWESEAASASYEERVRD
ncbi:6-pyruvoyl trahydropterin synthase family protein [Methanomassiliicoccus luminyensis]|jgi:6-pyruvoyltetrahydropterin/6-carboxytetrahydropterin synthase|uniref:6-pyruvoyl trahydropterin synthase family protein n=1 Tax=Methanomassiliicoccus luminyensis TaxID=1080712 RepID=UPI000379E915|nr:6-carboxytetrahydropterin synthase [Methanomassiliicoccus luminyensis]